MAVRFADSSERLIYTDGRALADDFEGGLLDAKAKWKKDSKIVVKGESPFGGQITETWGLSDDGRQLYVTTKMEGDGRRPTVESRRVYDPVVAADETTAELMPEAE
jgi:hypothetical protein